MKECCSTDQNCCCPCHENHAQHNSKEECEMDPKYFLEIADLAWEEVLKDEIKKYILSTQKERMAKLAKIVAEGNNARWKNRCEKNQGCADFEEKLFGFFSQSKK